MAGQAIAGQARGVTISVDPANGNFTYTPTHLNATQGDKITFDAGGSQFAVMFKRSSPGDKIHLRNPAGAGEDTVDATNIGVHQYAAAIYVGGRVFVDGGCGDVGVSK